MESTQKLTYTLVSHFTTWKLNTKKFKYSLNVILLQYQRGKKSKILIFLVVTFHLFQYSVIMIKIPECGNPQTLEAVAGGLLPGVQGQPG